MYFTHHFRDPSIKWEGVSSNTVEMVFAYFWAEQQLLTPNFTGMTIEETGVTKDIIRDWVESHPLANLTELADFTSRLVTDYRENQADLADRN